MSELLLSRAETGALPLQGAFNLRDFGGYEAVDGRRVRRGMLYRSGTMARLTQGDAEHLRSLGIRAICDFRRTSERAQEPTRWHGEDVHYYVRDYSGSSGVLGDMLRAGTATAKDMRQAMLDLYRTIATDHAEAYRAMFDQILAGRLPLLINCAAGKDRTGAGAVLILGALGVPRATIIEDYLLTNLHADWDWLFAGADTGLSRMRAQMADVIEPMLMADRDYIDVLFAQLDADHGGIEGYLSEQLGVDAAARGAMRELLLH